MSGFVALVRFDGSLPDDPLFERAASKIAQRGPDGQWRWGDHCCRLSQTWLSTSGPAGNGREPPPVDEYAVVADARIDARDKLLQAFSGAGRRVNPAASDAELIGHAWAIWGTESPARLTGDFSFAIWCPATRTLFCARDRFGVRPLFYGWNGPDLLVSNDLGAMLAGELGGELHEPAIADFLLFSGNQDPSRTTFERIRRVPPAHSLTFHGPDARANRYWSLPQLAAPRKITEQEAREEFRALLLQAVRDRQRGDPVAVSLSGGVDSTSIAAAATRSGGGKVFAVTAGYDHLVADDERLFAERAAAALGIDLEFHPSDDYGLFDRWDNPWCRGLEPVDTPMRAAFVDLMSRLGRYSRVLLTGQAGDAVLYTSHRYFVDLLRKGHLLRVAHDALRYAMTRRRMPPLLLRSHARRALGLLTEVPEFPPWLRQDFVSRYDLRERWRAFWDWKRGARRFHRWRPEAAYLIEQPLWANAFESHDAAWTGALLDLSVPYFDRRIVEFLFALPPMPYFADKDLVRQSMSGWLPDAIRLRPKHPFGHNPAEVLMRKALRDHGSLPEVSAAAEPFLEPRILRELLRSKLEAGRSVNEELPGLCLSKWLSYR